jgi:hypothetical protein
MMRKRLHIEPLETRHLLASNLAAIAGAVFEDADHDGVPEWADGDRPIAGVPVLLTGTDASGPVARSTLTSTDGSYRFDNLQAGRYQVAQPPAAGFLAPYGSPQDVTVSAADAMGIMRTLVDDFDGVPQTIDARSPGANPTESSVADSHAMGGTRDLTARVTTALGQTTLSSNLLTNPSSLASMSANNSTSDYVVTWDGDRDPQTVDYVGLGGRDLTDGGDSTALRLLIGVDQPLQSLTMRVYSEANRWSEATVALADTGGLPTAEVVIPYAGGFTAGGTGPADFTNVGAIQLAYRATELGADFAVDVIGSFGPTVLARDFANIRALPAIEVEKSTNGEDADVPTGPLVSAGATVTFDYSVSNPGNTDLTDIVVVDDNGTPNDTTDDLHPQPLLSGAFNVGDVNADNALNPSERWWYRAVRTATAGQHMNMCVVVAADPQGGQVRDEDSSHHFGVQAGVDIETAVNGRDADAPGSGPEVYIGTTATFTYTVRNTGNVPLAHVVVTDDNGTPDNPSDDFFATYIKGDENGDRLLDLTEVWRYTAMRTVTEGVYQNSGTVTAEDPLWTATAQDGVAKSGDLNTGSLISGDPLAPTVSDVDPSNYVGVLAPRVFSKRRFLASS